MRTDAAAMQISETRLADGLLLLGFILLPR
jgi:hypothetical protein